LSAKNSSRKFCYVRDCATAAGGEVNVGIASEFVQHLAGLLEEFVLYFPRNHQNSLDLVKNLFVVAVENVAVCMQNDRL